MLVAGVKKGLLEKRKIKQLLGKKLDLYEQMKKQWSKHQVFGHTKNQSWTFHLSQINPSYLKLFFFVILHRCFPKTERPSLQNKKISVYGQKVFASILVNIMYK